MSATRSISVGTAIPVKDAATTAAGYASANKSADAIIIQSATISRAGGMRKAPGRGQGLALLVIADW